MTPWFELPPALDCGWNPGTHVAIVGAGLAGLCAARAFAVRGFYVTVYEAAEHCAAGASASPAGIVKPYVTREPSDAMRFYQLAYNALFNCLDALDNQPGFNAVGAMHLIDSTYPDNDERYKNLDAADVDDVAGTSLNSRALYFENAGWVSVKQLCISLLNDVIKRNGKFKNLHRLTNIQRHAFNNEWVLQFENQPDAHAPQVILASGIGLSHSPYLNDVPFTPARGQVTQFKRSFALNTVVSGKRYAIPDENSVWVGASFDRGNANPALIDEDDASNAKHAQALLPELTEPLAQIENRFAGVRSTTVDRFPVVGPVPNSEHARNVYADIHHGRQLNSYPKPTFYAGLAVLGGLGSRGIAAAPYASDLLADWACGGRELSHQNRLLSPLRFLIRDLKRHKQPV